MHRLKIFYGFKDSFAYNKFDYIVAIGDSVETSMKKHLQLELLMLIKLLRLKMVLTLIYLSTARL